MLLPPLWAPLWALMPRCWSSTQTKLGGATQWAMGRPLKLQASRRRRPGGCRHCLQSEDEDPKPMEDVGLGRNVPEKQKRLLRGEASAARRQPGWGEDLSGTDEVSADRDPRDAIGAGQLLLTYAGRPESAPLPLRATPRPSPCCNRYHLAGRNSVFVPQRRQGSLHRPPSGGRAARVPAQVRGGAYTRPALCGLGAFSLLA